MPRKRGKKYSCINSASDNESLDLEYNAYVSRSKRIRTQSDTSGCSCNKQSKGKTSTSIKRKSKTNKTTKASTSKEPIPMVDLDSEDEINPVVTLSCDTETYIKNKVDNFFKNLESSDEEIDTKMTAKIQATLPEKKTKDFYELSDSDEDVKISRSFIKSVVSPSTSSSKNVQPNNLIHNHSSCDVIPEKLDPLDELLKECNEVLDLTEDKYEENVAPLSLEDLQKKTAEILGDVTSYIEKCKPKSTESEKPTVDSPAKKNPACPVCFETLGGSKQAMATLCGHMFCEPCILQVTKTTKKCPFCRKNLSKNKYHPIYI